MITGSAAWDNAGYGFTESGNAGALTVRGNTAFRNGKTGFAFERSTSLLRDNLAIGNGRESTLGDGVDAADNSWDRGGWSGAVLRTTDPASTLAPRSPDGGLPPTTFLTNTRDPRVGARWAPAVRQPGGSPGCPLVRSPGCPRRSALSRPGRRPVSARRRSTPPAPAHRDPAAG